MVALSLIQALPGGTSGALVGCSLGLAGPEGAAGFRRFGWTG